MSNKDKIKAQRETESKQLPQTLQVRYGKILKARLRPSVSSQQTDQSDACRVYQGYRVQYADCGKAFHGRNHYHAQPCRHGKQPEPAYKTVASDWVVPYHKYGNGTA